MRLRRWFGSALSKEVHAEFILSGLAFWLRMDGLSAAVCVWVFKGASLSTQPVDVPNIPQRVGDHTSERADERVCVCVVGVCTADFRSCLSAFGHTPCRVSTARLWRDYGEAVLPWTLARVMDGWDT